MAGWLLVSSKQNFGISSELKFTLQGLKKRHRKKAREIEPGDIFFYYITGEQKIACYVRVESFASQESDKIWVNLGKDPEECYPWRFEISPQLILEEKHWLNMADYSNRLLHFKKWPAKNWRLGLQGQIHRLRDEDTQLLLHDLNERNLG